MARGALDFTEGLERRQGVAARPGMEAAGSLWLQLVALLVPLVRGALPPIGRTTTSDGHVRTVAEDS